MTNLNTLNTTILEKVKEIMLDSFDVAMGGDVFKSEEENNKTQEEKYNDLIKKHSQFFLYAIKEAYEAGLKDAVDKYFLDAEERLSLTKENK